MIQEGVYFFPEDTLQTTGKDSSTVVNYLPVDSLWGRASSSIPARKYNLPENHSDSPGIAVSLFAMIFFLALILFSREIFSTVRFLAGSFYRLRDQYRNEEKLSYTSQRNLTAFIFSAFYPLLLTLVFGDILIDFLPFSKTGLLFTFLGAMAAVWLSRMAAFKFLSWITRDKNSFRLVERISYNHIIISVLLTFPAVLTIILLPGVEVVTQLMILAICCLLVYILFLVRSYQIIISNHYSHFFIILYLCTLEFLPTVLIANFILSL